MRRALALLPALVLSTGLTACSGGDEDAGAKAAYVKEAQAICTRANEARKAAGTPGSATEIPGFVRKVVTIASDASAELNALEPPEQDAAELDEKLLAPLREQVGRGQAFAKQVEEAGAKKDTAGVLKLLGSAPLDTTADLEFARSYGLTACADAADLRT